MLSKAFIVACLAAITIAASIDQADKTDGPAQQAVEAKAVEELIDTAQDLIGKQFHVTNVNTDLTREEGDTTSHDTDRSNLNEGWISIRQKNSRRSRLDDGTKRDTDNNDIESKWDAFGQQWKDNGQKWPEYGEKLQPKWYTIGLEGINGEHSRDKKDKDTKVDAVDPNLNALLQMFKGNWDIIKTQEQDLKDEENSKLNTYRYRNNADRKSAKHGQKRGLQNSQSGRFKRQDPPIWGNCPGKLILTYIDDEYKCVDAIIDSRVYDKELDNCPNDKTKMQINGRMYCVKIRKLKEKNNNKERV